MPLNKIPHSESRSAPHNSGTNPAIVDATKIAIQVRTASKSGTSFFYLQPQLYKPSDGFGKRRLVRLHASPSHNRRPYRRLGSEAHQGRDAGSGASTDFL